LPEAVGVSFGCEILTEKERPKGQSERDALEIPTPRTRTTLAATAVPSDQIAGF